jgi:hypothetical protein
MQINFDHMFSFFILPLLLFGFHGTINLGWLDDPSDLLSIGSLFMLFIVTYEIGAKHYYARGRRLYFYSVFVIPLILSSISLAVWLAIKGNS